jgi:hypothetical protein
MVCCFLCLDDLFVDKGKLDQCLLSAVHELKVVFGYLSRRSSHAGLCDGSSEPRLVALAKFVDK